MTAYTKGPWTYDPSNGHDNIKDAHGGMICMVFRRTGLCIDAGCRSPEELRANAHAIAGLPDLLAAASEILECAEEYEGHDRMPLMFISSDLFNALRDAVAKAKGEA